MQGPINLDQVRRAHDRFLKDNDTWIKNALAAALDQADRHVETRSTFERQSGARSLKSATKGKTIRIPGGRRLRLYWPKKHAEFIDKGTRPHPIVARNRKFLRFRGRDGRWVFRRRVMHPGTRPYRFGSLAVRVAHREFGNRMGGYIKTARFHF